MEYFSNIKTTKRFSFCRFFLLLFLTNFISASTLNFSISSNPSRINPILATDSASGEISSWIFNGLFKYDKDANIIGDLAQSYKFITPKHLKIKLRKNVQWSDGAKFTSSDVIFTFNTLNSKKTFTPYKTTFTKVAKLVKINDYEIDVFYKEPYFKALHIWMMGILPKHLLENEKDIMTSKFNKQPIGTGPYTLRNFAIGKDIKLHVNKNYFAKTPKIETIKYKFVPDPTTSFTMLKQSKLDMGSISPLQLDRQLKDEFYDKYTIYEKESLGYTYMGFNLHNKKFKNKKIREAINLAINKQEIVDILFFSHGKVCTGPFLPGTFAFNDKVKANKFNLNKSKQLLKELGYDKKNRFSFTVITNANNSIRVNAAQILQYQLAKVGIDMKIKVLEWQAFINTVVMPRNFEAIILGWGLSLMPDARSIWHSSSAKKGGFNFVGYKNNIVDTNIQNAEKTTDIKKLGKLYKEIFYQISSDLPYIFLYIPNSITAISKEIKNTSSSVIGLTHNQEDWIKP
ncbi:MAG TPA: peptide ABC transporter substrate-binding protein [Arcobacter sp.]|nr:peptide ABC transporter substrate-binding protein [Arcobacter sp.]